MFGLTQNLMRNLFAALILIQSGFAYAIDEKPAPLVASEKPADFKGIGIKEHLGDQLDLSLKFKDEKGQDVTLAQYYDGEHPVIISLIYYACPGLCNFHLNGVIESLREMDWRAGDKYTLLAISFDPKETPDLAAGKKASYVKLYHNNKEGSDKGFHFLTADAETIKQLTQAVGFEYRWDEQSGEWAHASAAVITTPKGVISRYLHGIMFDSKTFKMSLIESTKGQVGSIIDQMIFYCFKYDPHQSKYTLYAFRLVQLGGVAIILVLAAILLPVWLRSRRGDNQA